MRISILRSYAMPLAGACLLPFCNPANLAWAQANAASDDQAAAISNGQARMLRAATMNGAITPGAPPSHLKFSFKIFDETGNVKDQGTLEESWVSESKYKRIYTGTASSQVEFGTSKGIFRSGDRNPMPYQVVFLRNDFIRPLIDVEKVPELHFWFEARRIEGVSLDCILAGSPRDLTPPRPNGIDPTVCVDWRTYALRSKIFLPGIHEDRFENPVSYQGRFVAGDVQIIQRGKLDSSAHLETVDAIADLREADFVPPADAVHVPPPPATLIPIGSLSDSRGPEGTSQPRRIIISPGVSQGLLVKSVAPEYPEVARNSHVSGLVVLQATIGKDGKLANLKVVSGPALLQQAAMDSVKQWVYRPYMLNGAPVEVETTINVVFNLPNRQ